MMKIEEDMGGVQS